MEYHVNQTNQPHELPKKKWNIVLDNLLGIWELQKLIAWRVHVCGTQYLSVCHLVIAVFDYVAAVA